jgi:hypothetical protein
MTTAAIDTIWKAIQESERSDDLAFIDALARKMLSARSDAPGRELITAVGADPLRMSCDPLSTSTQAPG